MARYTIEISDDDYEKMVDNKDVLTNSTMLWILHDIVDQIVE